MPRPHNIPPVQMFWRHAALPFAESRQAQDSEASYAAHTHPQLSIGAIDRGSVHLVCDRLQTTLAAGDAVLIPAGQVHACNPDTGHPRSYQMLYLDEHWLAELVGEMGQLDAVAFAPRIERRAPGYLHAALTRLNVCLFSKAGLGDKEAALIGFAGEVFGPPAARQADLRMPPESLTRIRAMIAARCTETLPLDMLARAAGMSRYHFVRAFRRATGMTPHAWQLDARIHRARALLDQGMPLAELALQLGFADQSHFQRAFKQRVAVTPRQYRRNIVQERTG